MLPTLRRSTARAAQTIFAPSTPLFPSAISIVRVTGPDALLVWKQMTAPPAVKGGKGKAREQDQEPKARFAHLRRIVHPRTGEQMDEGLVLFFPAKSSLTGLPLLEMHCHGSVPLVKKLLELLPTLRPASSSSASNPQRALLRLAEPGEFTRLAMETGRMGLVQVEGLRDLVGARTEWERRAAARGLEMEKAYELLRTEIVSAMALLEAIIDFGEEESIGAETLKQARDQIQRLQAAIRVALDDGGRSEVLQQGGIKLAILGPPNAGKSSLLNWLAKREAAIVTPHAGTTRDVVELSLDLGGFPLRVADTAGIRETQDEIEKLGIQRAREWDRKADLKLVMLDLGGILAGHTAPALQDMLDDRTVLVVNKADLAGGQDSSAVEAALDGLKMLVSASGGIGVALVSIATGAGLQALKETLLKVLEERYSWDAPRNGHGVDLVVTQERHRAHLKDCLEYLGQASTWLEEGDDDVVAAAEELRAAVLSIGKITGRVDVEEVLGEIFRGFCIGK